MHDFEPRPSNGNDQVVADALTLASVVKAAHSREGIHDLSPEQQADVLYLMTHQQPRTNEEN